jgi:hypothetical protein
MMLAVYIISVLLCIVWVAAISVSAGTLPESDRNYFALAAVFCILCPVINTLVAIAGIAAIMVVFYSGYK